MVNIISVVVLAVVVGTALLYIRKARKSGRKCIGCPYSSSCGRNQNSSCGGCSGSR